MRRNPMVRVAVFALALLLVVLAAGGPNQAGALAGLRGAGPGAVAGLVWIVLFPAVVLVVPPLLLTGLAEAVHARWTRARTPSGPAGLGSRSGPGDT